MTDIHDILRQHLSDEQHKAAVDPAREVLCLACAGSGKSRTLAFRIAWLLDQGADPASIVAFTFTEKAANSIKLRVAEALEATGRNPTALGAMYIGTIHSYCHHILGAIDARYRQFEVLDDNRLILYLVSRYAELGIYPLRQSWNTGYFRTINALADAWKVSNEERVDGAAITLRDELLGAALQRLRTGLDRDHFIDFSMMIRRALEALEREASGIHGLVPIAHLMVDEYQDVNTLQEALIRELHGRAESLFVVGDDDQAIYAWRGANVRNILTFEDRYDDCSVHTLPRNYRSTKAIVEVADRFAAEELGANRIAKQPTADNPPGPRDFRVLWFTERAAEAEWIAERIEDLLGTRYVSRDGSAARGLAPSDVAILMRSVRTRSYGVARHQAFTEALAARNIPFTLEAGGGLFDRPEVDVMRQTLELLRGGQPSRSTVQALFETAVVELFPRADFDEVAAVLTDWGRRIHVPSGGARQRLYPQTFVHQLLHAFGVSRREPPEAVMFDLGVFSRIIQDVETVYLSVDSRGRFNELLNFLGNVADQGYSTGGSEILRRPEAVTVSTVHQMKGLEFPVVFVVDVEANRFPKRRGQYKGRLPRELIASALDRGAYQSTREEEARLFYTAITRAERYLYVSGAERLPRLQRPAKPSVFAQRLDHPEKSTELVGLPSGLEPEERQPRIDERVVPTSYSEVRYYLRCPRDYRFRVAYGFSPAITEMFGFGQTIHSSIGRLHQEWNDAIPTPAQAGELARENFHLKHVPQSKDPVNRPGGYEQGQARAEQMVANYVEEYADDFRRQRQVEVQFEIPVRHAVISGTIDLLLRTDRTGEILDATVIDFKALDGGEDPLQEPKLDWTELALQVQLYAKAAKDVLGENAQTGAVHLLKDGQRIEVPVDDAAVEAATANVEWAVARVINGEFPKRPHPKKCESCDFRLLCNQEPEEFRGPELPPPLHLPNGRTRMARAFSEFQE